MAKVTVTIEDTESGAQVSWKSDTGFLHEDGSQAEQIGLYTLMLLAKAGNVELETVPAPSGEASN